MCQIGGKILLFLKLYLTKALSSKKTYISHSKLKYMKKTKNAPAHAAHDGKGFLELAGEAVAVLGEEIVEGKDKIVEVASEKFSAVKKAIKKFTKKKAAPAKKVKKKAVKKALKKAVKKSRPAARKAKSAKSKKSQPAKKRK
jgi:hypothetical protein